MLAVAEKKFIVYKCPYIGFLCVCWLGFLCSRWLLMPYGVIDLRNKLCSHTSLLKKEMILFMKLQVFMNWFTTYHYGDNLMFWRSQVWYCSIYHGIPYCTTVDRNHFVYAPRQRETTYSRLILGLRPANDRRRYKVMPSLIGWAQT